MPTERTILDELRALERRLDFLERGAAVGIPLTDQTIKGSHDRLDAILGAGGSTFNLDADNLEMVGGVLRFSAAAAGNGLTGGAGAALAVNPGTGLEISGDTVRIAAAAAGDGLAGGAGSALAVSCDGVTIETNSDKIRIKGLTRTLFVPATRGWVGSEGPSNAVHAWSGAGYPCGDGVLTAIFGSFYLPADYASGLSIAAVVQADGSTGNMYVQLTCFYATAGEAYTAASNATGYSAIAVSTTLQFILATGSSAAAGDVVTCRFARAANQASDTATAENVMCMGFIATYTASR